MPDSVDEEIQGIVQQAQVLLQSGTISQDDYYKCILVAAQKSCHADDVTTAMGLMQNIPRVYFKNALPHQVLADPLFGKLVAYIAEKLLEAGFASLHEDLGFIQAPGIA
jgi:hypothetical protein